MKIWQQWRLNDDEKDDMQVILLTECDGGGGLSFVRKSKIEGEVFGEYFGLLI